MLQTDMGGATDDPSVDLPFPVGEPVHTCMYIDAGPRVVDSLHRMLPTGRAERRLSPAVVARMCAGGGRWFRVGEPVHTCTYIVAGPRVVDAFIYLFAAVWTSRGGPCLSSTLAAML